LNARHLFEHSLSRTTAYKTVPRWMRCANVRTSWPYFAHRTPSSLPSTPSQACFCIRDGVQSRVDRLNSPPDR